MKTVVCTYKGVTEYERGNDATRSKALFNEVQDEKGDYLHPIATCGFSKLFKRSNMLIGETYRITCKNELEIPEFNHIPLNLPWIKKIELL